MIQKISRNFVPIAANLYKIRDSKDAAGDLFRSAQKQKAQYQGFWILTAEGKLLSAHHDHSEKRWTEEVLAAIDEGIEKAGPIKPRSPEPKDVLPDWGKGVQKDGRVTLAIWTRYFFEGRGIATGAIDAVTWSAKAASLWYQTSSPVLPVGVPVRVLASKPTIIPPAAVTAPVSRAIGTSFVALLPVACQ